MKFNRTWLLAAAPIVLVAVLLVAAHQRELRPINLVSGSGRPLGTPPDVRVLRNLEYVPGGGKARLLDLYLHEKSEGPRPLIIWIHGGAWSTGDKSGTPPQILTPLARGYQMACINYRLSHQAVFPAQIQDCKAAIRWLRAHADKYRIDPDRIGVWGMSAGGHLAALLGTSGGVAELEGDEGVTTASSRVQAVCDFYGNTDFFQQRGQWGKVDHDAPDSPEWQLFGGPLDENKARVVQASPITHITKDDPPFLIMHGDKDPIVPYSQSVLLYEALKKAGVDATFQTVPGGGHWLETPEINRTVGDFFDRVLKSGK